jgi:hypothetical protein
VLRITRFSTVFRAASSTCSIACRCQGVCCVLRSVGCWLHRNTTATDCRKCAEPVFVLLVFLRSCVQSLVFSFAHSLLLRSFDRSFPLFFFLFFFAFMAAFLFLPLLSFLRSLAGVFVLYSSITAEMRSVSCTTCSQVTPWAVCPTHF